MTAINLLSHNMQKRIWDMKWEALNPIQGEAIEKIMQSDFDIIISSATASGKTEAAFLPILSLIEKTGQNNLKVLYISPLKALINNQFDRISKLCELSNINVHKWHGDVGQNKKKNFVKNPSGILQITPESIESIFINKTEFISEIFNELEYIVIDEIHAFIGKERGMHLRSLIARIQLYVPKKIKIIALSATIGDMATVMYWINSKKPENIEIITDDNNPNRKQIKYHLMHFEKEKNTLAPLELYEDMFFLTEKNRSIIFCNNRSVVEETTILLKKIASRSNISNQYFAHHSSIDKKLREYAEIKMSTSLEPMTIIATSSLELGIDIGNVNIVIQNNSTFTVSSLKQRLGRSGRGIGESQILQLYTTDHGQLLQSIAVMELLLDRWVEPLNYYSKPYDILFHQILSILNEQLGVLINDFIILLEGNPLVEDIIIEEVLELLDFMISKDYIEKLQNDELILGLEGERILRSKEFYAVFNSQVEYHAMFGVKNIGTLNDVKHLNPGDNIYLAGEIWCIQSIDFKRKKVYIQKANSGKAPRFLGSGGEIHFRVREKMYEILCGNETFSYIDGTAKSVLDDLRFNYHYYNVTPGERIIWKSSDKYIMDVFTGTKIENTLKMLLSKKGLNVTGHEGIEQIVIKGISTDQELLNLFDEIVSEDWEGDELVGSLNIESLYIGKFSMYIPEKFVKQQFIIQNICIDEVKEYLKKFTFRIIDLSTTLIM